MPVIRSAKKKLRQDKKKEDRNNTLRKLLSQTIKKAQKNITPKTLQDSFRVIDKAVKNRIIHKNKGGHIKSGLSALLGKKGKLKKSEQPAVKKQKVSKKKAS